MITGKEEGMDPLVIEVNVHGRRIEALLDTGASHNFIAGKLARDLHLEKWSVAEELRLPVVGKGNTIKEQCRFVGAIGKDEILSNAYMVENLRYELIFGRPMMKELNIVLDFEGECITLGKKTRQTISWMGVTPSEPDFSYVNELTFNSDSTIPPLILDILKKYPSVFQDKLGRTQTVSHDIKILPNTSPIRSPAYTYSKEKEEEIKRQVREMERMGIIEPSSSPWSSPVVLIKKSEGAFRFCVDYRKLNAVTIPDSYPMQSLPKVIKGMGGSAKIRSTLDMKSGFWQVDLTPEARERTAFSTPLGLFQFKVMPFGLRNSPATFQRLMGEVFRGYEGVFLKVYLDDVIFYSNSLEEHAVHLDKGLHRLQQHGLTCNKKKSVLLKETIPFLGHLVNETGISPNPEKFKALKEIPRPNKIKQLQRFLGLCNWFRAFIPHFADKCAPLTDLGKKNCKWKWGREQEEAFQSIKDEICANTVVLASPNPELPIILQTDASNLGLGAVVYQETDTGKSIIAFGSKKLNDTQRAYHTMEKECYAIDWAVKKYRHYLEGRPFTLKTDNKALLWLNKTKEVNSKVLRWSLHLMEYDFNIEHCPGKENLAADALSRYPTGEPSQEDDTDADRMVPPTRNQKIMAEVELLHVEGEFAGSKSMFERVCQQQDQHPFIKQLKNLLKKTSGIKFPKRVKRWAKRCVLREGGVFKVEERQDGERIERMLLPETMVNEILQHFHDTTLAAHPGAKEMARAIAHRYVWPGLSKDVNEYVRSCHQCAKCKANNHPDRGAILARSPSGVWESISVDLMGPYPRTKNGKRYIFVITDGFTKWIETFTLAVASVNKLVSILETEVFARYGYPKNCLSDNGPQFRSKCWKDKGKEWGVEMWTSPGYFPQANPTERRNQEIKKLLRLTIGKNHRTWDQHVHHLSFSLRDRVNNCTGYSPAELFLGRHLKRPGDWEGVIIREEDPDVMLKKLQRRTDLAKESADKYGVRYTVKPVSQQDFMEGDLVYTKTHPLSNAQQGFHAGFAEKWEGPHRIKKGLSEDVFLIKIRGRPRKIHRSQMKKVPATASVEITELRDAAGPGLALNDTIHCIPGASHQKRHPRNAGMAEAKKTFMKARFLE